MTRNHYELSKQFDMDKRRDNFVRAKSRAIFAKEKPTKEAESIFRTPPYSCTGYSKNGGHKHDRQ